MDDLLEEITFDKLRSRFTENAVSDFALSLVIRRVRKIVRHHQEIQEIEKGLNHEDT